MALIYTVRHKRLKIGATVLSEAHRYFDKNNRTNEWELQDAILSLTGGEVTVPLSTIRFTLYNAGFHHLGGGVWCRTKEETAE